MSFAREIRQTNLDLTSVGQKAVDKLCCSGLGKAHPANAAVPMVMLFLAANRRVTFHPFTFIILAVITQNARIVGVIIASFSVL